MIIYIFFTFLLFCILFLISKEDMQTMLISENKLKILAFFGISYLVCLSLSTSKINLLDLIINNLFSMIIIFIIMYSVSYISFKLLRTNSLGLGDIKLSSISTIWLGLELSLISLCISFLLSAIYSMYGKITKRFKRFQQYPFAPFLSIGIFSSWILYKIQTF